MPEISEGELAKLRADSAYVDNLFATFDRIFTPSKCQKCGQPIIWLVSKNKKNVPVSESGKVHFDDCPEGEKLKGAQAAPPTAPPARQAAEYPPAIPDDDIPF